MKKYLQLFVVVALVLAVIGIAGSSPVWAGKLFAPAQPKPASDYVPADLNYAQPFSIVVTSSGSYLVGGVCKIDVEYKVTGLKDDVDAEVPITEARQVPFGGEGDLFYPGCHVVHFKADAAINEASANDGSWRVCFAERLDVDMVIYYYLDNPPGGVGARVWVALPTTKDNGFACAPAMYTGVYMPAGRFQNRPGGVENATIDNFAPTPVPGSVQPPNPYNTITTSGTYSVGGICTLVVEYKVEFLSDDFFVETPVRGNLIVTYPETKDDYFYLPGCHVLHFVKSNVQKSMTNDQGVWTICFAAPPDNVMTIYFYESMVHKDKDEKITAPWIALTTNTSNGMACAPAMGTGVYVPAGH